ncbi:MAG TPA: glycosyltransferase family 39 protein [Gemmatimonadaceae bacterium]|nr:glycosyltransferase family 39 protein [Gemmatimonadaceae bacterium]
MPRQPGNRPAVQRHPAQLRPLISLKSLLDQAISDSPPASRRSWWLLAGLLTAYALLVWSTRQTGIYTGEDDAGYLLLSDALREGTYREWQWLGDPIANRFPPGYPALLMIVRLLVPNGLLAATLLGIGFSVVGLVALYDVVRRRIGSDIGLASVAIIVVNPALVSDAGGAMSEAVFTSLILLTLWAAVRADETNRSRDAVLAMALAIAASFVRAAGLTVPLVLLLHWALTRRWKRLAILALVLACTIGAWHAWTVVAPTSVERRSYVADAAKIAQTQSDQQSAIVNAAVRGSRSARTYLSQDLPWKLAQPTVPGTLIDNVFWLALNLGCAFTGLVLLWKRWRPAALFLVVYGSLLMAWTWHVDRFLQPALPLILVSMFVGASWLASRITPRAGAWGVGVVLTLLAAPALATDADTVASATTCRVDPYERLECADARSLDLVSLARAAGSTLPGDAVVFAPKERAFHYHSGLKLPIMDALLEVPADSFASELRARGVTHAVLSTAGYDYRRARSLLTAICRELDVSQVVARETLMFEVRSTPLETPGPACVLLEHTRPRP